MAALVSAPVAVYSTAASWVTAPAVGAAGAAWLEVGRDDGDARVVGTFRGDRLVIRTTGRARGVVHEPCMETPCSTVQAPVAVAAHGSFAYAVAFPGTGGYVADVGADGRSRVVAEDQTDPHRIALPHPVASTGAAIAWVDENRIHLAPPSGRPDAIVVRGARTGGRIVALGAGPAGIAWVARTDAGGTEIRVRTAVGGISVRATESDAATARFVSVGIADDGTVVAVRREADGAKWRTRLVALAVDGTSRTLAATAPLDVATTATVPRVSVSGTRAAVRMIGGRTGSLDVIWVVDLATGARERVDVVRRAAARLSDASLGAGRLVWARDSLAADGGLRRSRLMSATLVD